MGCTGNDEQAICDLIDKGLQKKENLMEEIESFGVMPIYHEICEFCGSSDTKSWSKEKSVKISDGWLIKRYIEIECKSCGHRHEKAT